MSISPGRSRFGRRVFALFIVASLGPTIVLALLSFGQVESLIADQTRRRMHAETKGIGQTLMERLTMAAAEGRLRVAAAERGLATPARDRPRTRLLPETPPDVISGLDDAALRHLAASRFALRVAPHENAPADVALVFGRDEPRVVTIDPQYLWGVPIDDSLHLCIVDADARPLSCDRFFASGAMEAIAASMARRRAGPAEWTEGGTRVVGYHWELFLGAEFASPGWTVVVAADRASVLAPLVQFRSVFPAVAVTSLLLVTLLSLSLIGRSTGPLARLMAGTRRIAAGDFTAPVEVDTQDEFSELADGFNRMSRRLGRQFHTLEAMAAIDRLILSATDASHVVDVLMERIPEVVDCDELAIVTVDDEGTGALVRWRDRDGAIHEPRATTIDAAARAALTEASGPVEFGAEHAPTFFRKALAGDACEHWIAVPVSVSGKLAAVIAHGFAEAPEVAEEETARVRQLGDRAAVALSNAAWEEKLYHQAHYDALTDLPNRALFHDRMRQAVARARRDGSVVALMFLDLDRFKAVNDWLGHAAGDALLTRVAERLLGAVRSVDTVVRFGGDEFLIILPDIPRDGSLLSRASRVAESIYTALGPPVVVEGQEVAVSSSIGIALYPKDGDEVDDLLRQADTALYHAKASGRGTYQFFSTDLNEASRARAELTRELERALEDDELDLEYLPKLDFATGAIVGAECLLRWRHPERGVLAPREVLSAAEDSGLLEEVGRWVVRTACAQLRVWEDRGRAPLTLSVNLSRREFRDRDIARVLRGAIRDCAIPADRLEIELAESLVMAEIERTLATLQEIAEIGVKIVIDDFCTGYSSVSHLAQYPLHGVKIDRAFVADVPTRAVAREVVGASAALASRLGLEVVAEGVESLTHARAVQVLGCDAAQGFWIGRPMRAKALASFADAWDAASMVRTLAGDGEPAPAHVVGAGAGQS